MGSRVSPGVSPGRSKAMTGAAVGPGSISGLSRKDADQVLSRAEKLRGDNFTPETVRIASDFLGLPDRSPPSLRKFALPPSVRDKDLLLYNQKTDGPPSMTIPQESILPNTSPPGYQFTPNPPSGPPGFVPKNTFPSTPPPGYYGDEFLTEIPRELPQELGVGDKEFLKRILNPPELYPTQRNPLSSFGGGASGGLGGILATLIQQGLL
jgi:hypothetical protein|tara:strand:+ start:1093 stop:1719 length:627 start_codon:yes stop_codon:yes gene_type:complete